MTPLNRAGTQTFLLHLFSSAIQGSAPLQPEAPLGGVRRLVDELLGRQLGRDPEQAAVGGVSRAPDPVLPGGRRRATDVHVPDIVLVLVLRLGLQHSDALRRPVRPGEPEPGRVLGRRVPRPGPGHHALLGAPREAAPTVHGPAGQASRCQQPEHRPEKSVRPPSAQTEQFGLPQSRAAQGAREVSLKCLCRGEPLGCFTRLYSA